MDDPRLALLSIDPAAVLSILKTDEMLHDATVLSIAESLDGWLICGYVYRETATMLAQEIRGDDLVGPVLVSAVPMADYSAIVDAGRSYWLKNDQLDETPPNVDKSQRT